VVRPITIQSAELSRAATSAAARCEPEEEAAEQTGGEKRMTNLGKVDVPQEAFMAVLSVGREPGK